jgi:hypothetical protein
MRPPPTILPVILLATAAFLIPSCTVLKTMRDHKDIRYVRDNEHLYHEKAVAAVTYAYNTGIHDIRTDTLQDKKLRKKLQGLGSITVTFGQKGNEPDEPADSIVTFLTPTLLLGWREVVYDFSARQRTYPTDRSNIASYIFVNVGNRIYYRRRPFPMM